MKRVIRAGIDTDQKLRFVKSVKIKVDELLTSLDAAAHYTHGEIDDIVGHDFYDRLLDAQENLDEFCDREGI